MAFDSESFLKRLLGEALFYDEEYFVGGVLSLIDPQGKKERFLAAYLPNDGQFVIEEATEWDDYDEEDDDIGYAIATDSKEHGLYESVEEVSDVLLALAKEHGLEPSLSLSTDDEDDE